MDDREVLKQIEQLVDEEHSLLDGRAGGKLEAEGHERLRSIEISLDQCWDLLRQRRALRDARVDPDQAHVRDPRTVERYEQ